MDEFELKVSRFIKRHQLIPKGSHILVGVSGGPDSLALLYFLKRYQEEFGISITVAHLDHMLRGEQSYEELLYVQKICKEWGIPFEGKQINVPKEMKERPGSSEKIARELRYDFFRSVMERRQISTLALAHHGDDQIETILMRLTRGSELKAAAGIQVKRPFVPGLVIRPFLCVTKSEIEDYIKQNDLHPVYDPTNQLDIYTRNRFRHKVLPFLKAENENVHLHFQRFSERLSVDENYLMDLAKKAYNNLKIRELNGGLSVNINEIKTIPFPLQRRCIQLILNYLYEGKIPEGLTAIHMEAILELMDKSNPSGQIDLPKSLKVIRSYELCTFSFLDQTAEPFFYQWHKGERIFLPNGKQLIVKEGNVSSVLGKDTFVLDNRISFPLYVRSRKDGDRIRIKGLGTKKIKSLFIDCKIPKYDRDRWPIVTDQNDNILWVPGLRKSIFEATGQRNGQSIILQYI